MAEVSSVTQDVLKTLLTCSICSKMFSDPRSLPCLHTFCKLCIVNIIKKNDDCITCPTCRRKVPIPAKGEDSFLKNLYIGRFIEARHGKSDFSDPCSVCVLRGVTVTSLFRCLDCLDFLCKQCSKGHRSSSFTADHKIVSYEDLMQGKYDANILRNDNIHCIKHGIITGYYCISCQSLICEQCAIAEHKTHELVMKETAAQDAKIKITKIIENGTTRMFRLKKWLDNILSKKQHLEMSENQIISEVNKTANYILQMIKKERDDIFEKIKIHFARPRREYSRQQSMIESVMISTRDIVGICNHAVIHSSNVNLLLLSDTIRGGLKDIQEAEEMIQHWLIPDEHQQIQSTLRTVKDKEETMNMMTYQLVPHSLEEGLGVIQESKELTTSEDIQDKPLQLRVDIDESKEVTQKDVSGEAVKLQLQVRKIDWPVLSLIGADIQIGDNDLNPTEEQCKDVHLFSGRTETDFKPLELDFVNIGKQKTCPADGTTETDQDKKTFNNSNTVNTQTLQMESKQQKILSFKQTFNVSVKKDVFQVEIKGLCFWQRNRLLILDDSNRKLKGVSMDGTVLDCHQFLKQPIFPNKIACIDQRIAGIMQNYMYIFTITCDILKKIKLTDTVTKDSSFYLTSRSGEFLVGRQSDNLLVSFLPSGELKSKWKCPINVPFVSMSSNTEGQLLFCSWENLGCVHLVSISGKEIQQFVRPVKEHWLPTDACSDSHGYIYASDLNKCDIVMFSPQGQMIFKCFAYDHSLCRPLYMITDSDNLYVAGEGAEVLVYNIKVPQ